MDRQHNRMVNETVEQWRPYSQRIRRYTISRVPADQVDYVSNSSPSHPLY
jgi:hypothetical protein